MRYLLCALIGYAVGTINPAYLISKLRGFDIRKQGSKNAGASNALLLLGKSIGVFCGLFDIFKATLVIWLMEWIFSDLPYVFAVTGTACILGHIFPFYMNFRGGKGLSSLGGMILAYDWRVFLIMLAGEFVIAFVSNYLCFVSLTASVIFPVVYLILRRDLLGALILMVAGACIIWRHRENLKRIQAGTEARFSYLWNKENEIARVKENESKQSKDA